MGLGLSRQRRQYEAIRTMSDERQHSSSAYLVGKTNPQQAGAATAKAAPGKIVIGHGDKIL